MSTSGCVSLGDVFAMLKHCLPGWTQENGLAEGRHNYRIIYGGRTYPGFPTGGHGKRAGRGEVQKGHVKGLVQFFGIVECAAREIEMLR